MEVECPICDASFSADKIEIHAEECVQARFGSSVKGKSGLSSDSKNSPRQGKRKTSNPLGLESTPQTDVAGPSKAASTPPSSKKSRKEQVQAWSFLSKSGKTSGPGHITRLTDDGGSSSNTERGTQGQRGPLSQAASRRASTGDSGVPLAERMRPVSLDNYIGQESILKSHAFLRTLLQQDNFTNMILWGPPGCGKTSLANVIRERCRGSDRWRYTSLSACTSGVADVKAAVTEARSAQQLRGKRTILFMDEVHRFNKAQQDIFLPHVESGLLTLIGATTENPSFTLNSALLSRCRVITLEALTPKHIRMILRRALRRLRVQIHKDDEEEEEKSREADKEGNPTNGKLDDDSSSSEDDDDDNDDEELEKDGENGAPVKSRLKMSSGALRWISGMSGGDARCALSTLQILTDSRTTGLITREHAKEALQRSHVLYDRKGDEHYNFASALQKSIRGGDDNAALYWTMRMVRGGEDPRFIARRLLRTAAEDIGLGCPEAVTLATSTMQAVQMLGMPESDVILAQCAVYLARAKHNPEVYMAMGRINQHIENHAGPLPPVPLHLRNASTKLMKDLGYGRGYSHAPNKVRNIAYMPDALKGVNFFR